MDEYSKHADNCAHLSNFAWQRYRHLPTPEAISKGERFDNILGRIWLGNYFNRYAAIRCPGGYQW